MIRNFKKGFDLVYHPRVHCPVCKEEMFANALVCPNCKTDFTKAPYNRRTTWQKITMKIILVIVALIALAISISGAPIIIGIIVGLALYGIGYIIVQKIQSIKNYFHK